VIVRVHSAPGRVSLTVRHGEPDEGAESVPDNRIARERAR
jgi:hypothetical protein